MASSGSSAPATGSGVVIRHSTPWIPGRHGAAFLRPLVGGLLRRLASSGRQSPAGPAQ